MEKNQFKIKTILKNKYLKNYSEERVLILMQWLSARDNFAPQKIFNNIWTTYGAIFGYQKVCGRGGRGAATITEVKDVVVCILHSILMHRTTTHSNEGKEDEKEEK